MVNNYKPKIIPEIEKDSSIHIYLPFSIKWKGKKYDGTFMIISSENIGIEEYGIEWSNEIPEFGEFESYIYEEIEEKLLKEALKRYNIQ